MANARFDASILAMPLPAMSYAVPCAARAQWHWQAAQHGDALVETERLDRDLALIVKQHQCGVELPSSARRNTVSAGNGPCAAMPCCLARASAARERRSPRCRTCRRRQRAD